MRSFMSAEEISRLVKALSELGVCKIKLTGGEHTVIKYIFDMDLTLYSKKDFIDDTYDDTDDEKFYNSLKQKNKLRELLLANPSKKYLLTNASFEHADNV